MNRCFFRSFAARVVPLLAAASFLFCALPQPAEAQLWNEIKNKAKQVATGKALEQVDQRFGDVIAKSVSDGRFIAALSPWADEDGSGRADYTSVSGEALFVPTGSGFALMLCEDAGGRGWSTRLRLEGPSGRALAPQDSSTYDLASTLAALQVTDAHARVSGGATGTVTLQSVEENLWAGTARLTLPAAFLGGEAGEDGEDGEAEPVQVAATFRAQPAANAGSYSACAASGLSPR